MSKLNAGKLLAAAALAAMTGCGPEDHQSHFQVAAYGDARQARLVPQGHDWAPGSVVEIKIWGEPQRVRGEIVTNGAWRTVSTLAADGAGMFGYTPGAVTISVPRTCGAPPEWLARPQVLARDTGTGLFRLTTVEASHWFNYQPCP